MGLKWHRGTTAGFTQGRRGDQQFIRDHHSKEHTALWVLEEEGEISRAVLSCEGLSQTETFLSNLVLNIAMTQQQKKTNIRTKYFAEHTHGSSNIG